MIRPSLDNGSNNKPEYDYHWWLNTGANLRWPGFPTNSYAATGSRDQQMMIIPDEQLAIAHLG